MIIPRKAIELILVTEGVDQPSKWPGGASGITLGYGYDLGYEENFASDWNGLLPSGHIARLKSALGVKGLAAKAIARRFLDIKIQPAAALQVFSTKTLPHYTDETLRAFHGADQLPALAIGVLVSLVFNRGTSMVDDPKRRPEQTRLEMRAIRNLIAAFSLKQLSCAQCLAGIADQLRQMKRLWVGKGEDGLLVRREREAKLIEEAAAETGTTGTQSS